MNTYTILYGIDSTNYNVHGLIHLPNFIKAHAKFSAFKYENYLGFKKKCLNCY